MRFSEVAAFLRRGLGDLRAWIDRKLGWRSRRISFERVEDLPDTLKPETLYVAGDGPHTWAAAMMCPCGCGDIIQLNLMKQARPCWTVRCHRDGTVSLIPSVWRTKGCQSHFFVRQSRIQWCTNGKAESNVSGASDSARRSQHPSVESAARPRCLIPATLRGACRFGLAAETFRPSFFCKSW